MKNEKVPCPVCHYPAPASFVGEGRYHLCICKTCGLVFSDPMPTEEQLAEYYQGFLFNRPSDLKEYSKEISRRRKELCCRFGKGIKKGVNFLDFGGGMGAASLAAAELGLNVTMYEIDQQAVEFVREQEQSSLIRIVTDLSGLGDHRFDLIFCDNVIEHVIDPQRLMSDLYRRLNPGGVLVFKTPKAQAIEMFFYPNIWLWAYIRRVQKFNGFRAAVRAIFLRPWCWEAPRHLYSFSKDSLFRLAEKVGSDSVEIKSYYMPLLKYTTSLRHALCPSRRVKTTIKRMICFPLVLLEWASKFVQLFTRAFHLIPGTTLQIKLTRDKKTT